VERRAEWRKTRRKTRRKNVEAMMKRTDLVVVVVLWKEFFFL